MIGELVVLYEQDEIEVFFSWSNLMFRFLLTETKLDMEESFS